MNWGLLAAAAAAGLLVGISKAGFGGGTGLLATPLMAMVLPAREALGTLLLMLIFCDWAACWFYRKDWVWPPMRYFFPGCLAGILAASLFLGQVSGPWLKMVLGWFCLLFCVLQWLRERLGQSEVAVQPDWKRGTVAGTASGISSTLAHAAGPVFAMYLLPMKLSPRLFVGTTSMTFAVVNLLKVPGYLALGMIDRTALLRALCLLPFVFTGTLLGLWMNERVSRKWFVRIIYIVLFFTGVELVSGKSLLQALVSCATAHA